MYIKESDCDHLQLTINVIAANLILQEMQIRMQICKFLPSNNSSQHIMWGKRGSKHHRFNNAWLLFSISTICNLENIDDQQISNGDLITLQLNEGVIYMGQIEDDDSIDKYKYV